MSKIPYGIRSVKIENFRCIDKLELDFTDPQGNPSDIVVIGGPNGCGKTAVLEACYSLVQGNSPRIPESDPEIALRRLGSDSIRKGTGKYDISIAMQTPKGILDRSHTSLSHSLPNGHADAQVCSIYISSRRVQRLVGALSVSLGKTKKENYYPVMSSPESERLHELKQELLDTKAYESMGGKLTNNYFRYEQIVSPLNDMWKRFYPQSKQSFSVEPVDENPNHGFDVFLIGSNNSKVPVDMLSAGQLEIFTLFGILALLKLVPAIVFIDEPELHLDPQWHAALLHELRRFLPQVQFIVATHSPRIAESVSSYQRFYLVPEDDPRMIAWGLKKRETELAHV